MIGHFLLTLSEEEEDRVLTLPMRRGGITLVTNIGCLVQVVCGTGSVSWEDQRIQRTPHISIPDRYDSLCERFGEARVNFAIRMRILANRAARLPQEVCV